MERGSRPGSLVLLFLGLVESLFSSPEFILEATELGLASLEFVLAFFLVLADGILATPLIVGVVRWALGNC